MKKVTIIIPVYNVELCIEDSLKSALNQNYNNIEYIIVDDKGTDKSMYIVKQIINQYPSKNIIIIEHKENKGLSAARNSGIKQASGDYIFFMDSDDIISNDCIEKLYNSAELYNAEWVDGNVLVKGGNNSVLKPYKNRTINNQNLLALFFSGKIHISAWNKLINRKWLIKNNINFHEGLIYEDVLFVASLCEKANRISLISNYTYQYIIRNNSITSNVSEQSIKRQFNSIIYNLNEIKKLYNNLTNRKDADICKTWINMYSFKASCRLATLSFENDNLKQFYYKELSSFHKMSFSKNYTLLLKLPYSYFSTLVKIPYKIYKIIHK